MGLDSVTGVFITTDPAGDVSFRFPLTDDAVRREIRVLHEYQAQRYQQWYALLIQCPSGNPIRLTLNGNGDLVGESREYTTYGVPVWCGDGCKEVKIPTGVYTGRLVWSRAPDLRAWTAESIRDPSALPRPRLEVEEERARIVAENQRTNEDRYAPLETIRGRFAALAPEAVRVLDVEFIGRSVRVRKGFVDAAVPSAEQNARIDQLIAAVAGRFSPRGPRVRSSPCC